MIRILVAIYVLLAVATVSILGLRGDRSRREPLHIFPDMDLQAKYLPQGQNAFFRDGMNDRLPPVNTVPRGNKLDVREVFGADYSGDRLADTALLQGKDENGEWVRGFPIQVTSRMMETGREKYDLFCAVCHGLAGDGAGIVRQYGMVASNLTLDLYVEQPEGELFQTASWGKGLMMGYAERLSPEERWAIILYVRALQKSVRARASDIPEAKRKELGL